MNNDPRRVAQQLLDSIHNEVECERLFLELLRDKTDSSDLRLFETGLSVCKNLLWALGQWAETYHLDYPPKEPRALQLVVNNKKPHR